MRKVTVVYNLSEEGQKKSLLSGGTGTKQQRTSIDVQAEDLEKILNLKCTEVTYSGEVITYPGARSVYDAKYQKYKIVELDSVITSYDDLCAAIAKAEEKLNDIEKEETERKEAKKREEDEKIKAVELAYATGGLDAVREKLKGYDAYRWCDNRGLHEITSAFDAEEEQKKKEEAARREAEEKEKREWIEKYGSARLKKAFAAGYPCTTAYIKERVAIELGKDWLIDEKGEMDWRAPKIFPTEKALDLEKELKDKGYNAEIVWLTDDGVERDYDDEPFTPCEAIVIENYLGKYNIVKIIKSTD